MGMHSFWENIGTAILALLVIPICLGILVLEVGMLTSPIWAPKVLYIDSNAGQRHACTNAAQSAIPNAGIYALNHGDFNHIMGSDLGAHFWVDIEGTRHGKVKVVFEERTPTFLKIKMIPLGKLGEENPNCYASVVIKLMPDGDVIGNAIWTWGTGSGLFYIS